MDYHSLGQQLRDTALVAAVLNAAMVPICLLLTFEIRRGTQFSALFWSIMVRTIAWVVICTATVFAAVWVDPWVFFQTPERGIVAQFQLLTAGWVLSWTMCAVALIRARLRGKTLMTHRGTSVRITNGYNEKGVTP